MHNWVLPEYIEDVLPTDALSIEMTRRTLLDLFRVHGYDLVFPPLLEHVESLRSGTGLDMDLRTFKLVDQLSGRLIGVRADITPQVARIDAQLLNLSGVARLCYVGSVLHTLPLGHAKSREPLQIGAEIYGHQGIEADIEIQQLMLESLAKVGINDVQLDLGHVGVFRNLALRAGIASELESELFRVLQAKDVATLTVLAERVDSRYREAICRLPELYGGIEVLARARALFADFPEILHSLSMLEQVHSSLSPAVGRVSFDLAELRGYHYHSGMVFAVYAPGCASAIALGGRYDEVGRAYGRARPATGFSMDLKELAGILPSATVDAGILAPYCADAELQRKIGQLRDSGRRVVIDLPGHDTSPGQLRCKQKLELADGQWLVVEACESI